MSTATITIDESQYMLAAMTILSNMDRDQRAEIRNAIDEMDGAPRKTSKGSWMKLLTTGDISQARRGGYAFGGEFLRSRDISRMADGTLILVGGNHAPCTVVRVKDGDIQKACWVEHDLIRIEGLMDGDGRPSYGEVGVTDAMKKYPALMELGADHAYMAAWFALHFMGKM